MALSLSDWTLAASPQLVSISFPSLHIASKERVVGFEIHIKSGRIARLPDIPIGWSISVGNDPSWNTNISGTLIAGAAALDASFFREFVVIEKNESLGLPFSVEGEVVVTQDFSKERRIKVEMQDILLKQVVTP